MNVVWWRELKIIIKQENVLSVIRAECWVQSGKNCSTQEVEEKIETHIYMQLNDADNIF
jgi:hypothetical protein